MAQGYIWTRELSCHFHGRRLLLGCCWPRFFGLLVVVDIVIIMISYHNHIIFIIFLSLLFSHPMELCGWMVDDMDHRNRHHSAGQSVKAIQAAAAEEAGMGWE